MEELLRCLYAETCIMFSLLEVTEDWKLQGYNLLHLKMGDES